MHIQPSSFGDYEVLCARYPGLPSSPPTSISIINSDPYYSHGNGAAIKPLRVDVGRKQHKGGPSRIVTSIVVLSASLAITFGLPKECMDIIHLPQVSRKWIDEEDFFYFGRKMSCCKDIRFIEEKYGFYS